MMSQRYCPDCESPLPPDAPEGICPECLMKVGLEFSQDTTLSVEPIDDAKEEDLPNPGDQFGEYRIERDLGRGGMGAVYEAEQLETGRRVALKVLAHRLNSAEARARFFREGRLAASINHPNSVYVYGTGEVNGTPVIMMELVDGGTLQDRVKRNGPLPVGKAVDAIIDVISGLQAAQAKGILHRDVKPSNCFEDIDGSIKVGDFGLSISSEASEDTELTSDGLFLGTPAFCSPEQLRRDDLNARSDLYSVGVTLFYLLTGRTPFEGHTSVQLIANVLEKAPPSPKNFRPEIPDELARVVLRCLEKTPEERFRNYGELHRALMPFGTAAPAPAPLFQRCVAGAIDLGVVSFVSTAIGLCFAGGSMAELSIMGISFYSEGFSSKLIALTLLSLLAIIAYFALLEGRWGYSLGKAACRLRVVDANRNTPGLEKAALRAVIYIMIPDLAAKRQSWESVRFWLLDLAEELTAAMKDGTMPETRSLDRIWISAEGRAKLLDFPAPGLKNSKRGDHAYEPDSFLSAVASSALQGRIDRPAEDPLSAPVPLHARRFLEDSAVLSNPDRAGRALKRLTQRPTRVTRLHRLAVVAGCLPVPVLVFFFSCS